MEKKGRGEYRKKKDPSDLEVGCLLFDSAANTAYIIVETKIPNKTNSLRLCPLLPPKTNLGSLNKRRYQGRYISPDSPDFSPVLSLRYMDWQYVDRNLNVHNIGENPR